MSDDPPEPPPPPYESALARSRRLGVSETVTIVGVVNRTSLNDVIRYAPIPAAEKDAYKALLKATDKDGHYTVVIKEKKTGAGRAYPVDYSVASAISSRGIIRAPLWGGSYVELDLVACHHTILANLARRYEISTPALDEYLMNRPTWLKGVARAFNRTPEYAKELFTAALFGSKVEFVVGDDGVRRAFDAPAADPGNEPSRKFLHDFKLEMQGVAERLLRHPAVKKEYAENLRKLGLAKVASKLFCLFEMGERCAIQALLDAVDATDGELRYGEIIFDGVLLCAREGGPPTEEALALLCADAERRADEHFDLKVKFKAKPLAGGDIFPAGSDSASTRALLEKGSVWYASLRGAEGEQVALGRAQLHAGQKKHRFVFAMQTTVGMRFTARADWAGLQGKLRSGNVAVWEVAQRDAPVRPFVSFAGVDDAEVDGIVSAWSGTMAEYGVGEGMAVTVTTTASGGGCTLVADVALPSFEAVTLLNERAFGADTSMAQRMVKTDRVLMVRQAPLEDPDNHRNLRGGGTVDSACFSLPAGTQSKDCGALFASFNDAERAGVAASYKDVPWDDAYRTFVQAALPETVSDEDLPGLVLKCVKPGDVNNRHDKNFLKSVAGALWTFCPRGKERKAESDFKTWATEDGYNSNTNDRVDDAWLAATERFDAGLCEYAVFSRMMGHLHTRAPEIYAKWVESLSSVITGARCISRGDWFTVRCDNTKMPGPDAIGNLAELLETHKYIGLDAPPGMGKSMCFQSTTRELVKADEETSCLVLSTRVSVSHAFCILFNPGENGNPGEQMGVKFAHYKDDCAGWEERNECDHLICELESSVTLRRGYTLTLLDEFMTLLLQIASCINRTRFKSLCDVLVKLCKGAKYVMVADALLCSDVFGRFIEIVEGTRTPDVKALYLKYTPAVPSGRVVKIAVKKGSKFKEEDIQRAFDQRFADGESKFLVFTNVKKIVGNIEQSFKKAWKERHGEGHREPRILKLTAETYHKESKAAGNAGVDAWWVQYDLVIITPTVTNAISFNVPNHFDSVLAFCSNFSCVPPDVMQACLRPRYPRTKVIHIYVSVNTWGGHSSAIKNHEELMKDAKNRDTNATPMEKLVFSLATRSNVFAFNFYPDYLRKCFERIGFAVEMMGDEELDGTTPLAEPDEVIPMEYDLVPRVTEKAYKEYFKDKRLTDFEMVTALERACGVTVGAAEAPLMVENAVARFKFGTNLLNIESKRSADEDMQLSDKQVKGRDQLWKMHRGGDRKPLWQARRAYLYERGSPGIGKRCSQQLAERLKRKDFEHSVRQPWKKQFDVLGRALRYVGLASAVPTAGAGIVERERLLSAYQDLVNLLPDVNVHFGKNITGGAASGALRSDKVKVANAARIVNAVVTAWNPAVAFIAMSRKRKSSTRESDYKLTFKKEWNVDNAAELLHSDNLLGKDEGESDDEAEGESDDEAEGESDDEAEGEGGGGGAAGGDGGGVE